MDEVQIRKVLESMETDPTLATESAYRANALLWPNNRISFSDIHLTYLKLHPMLSPKDYLSNLRLRSKKRI